MRVAALLLAILCFVAGDQYYAPCTATHSIVPDSGANLAHAIAYGVRRNDYVAIYIATLPNGGTTVYALHLDPSGAVLGGRIPLMADEDYPFKKANPVIAYSTKRNVYTAMWEYDYYGNGTDIDIYAANLDEYGQLWEDVDAFAYSSDHETNPSLYWNEELDQFLFLYVRNLNDTANYIWIRRLNEYGVLTDGFDFAKIQNSTADGAPKAVWNPDKKVYALVFEGDYPGRDNWRSIWMAELDGMGNPGGRAYPVGAIEYLTAGAPHEHSPTVMYAPTIQRYTVVFDVYPEGSAVHYSNAVSTSVDPDTFATMALSILTSGSGITSNPAVAYSTEDTSFLILFQYIRGNGYGLRGVYLNQHLYVEELFEVDGNNTNSLTNPSVTYNIAQNQYLGIWKSAPFDPYAEKRGSQDSQGVESRPIMPQAREPRRFENVMPAMSMPITSRDAMVSEIVEKRTKAKPIQRKRSVQVESKLNDKRQDLYVNGLRAVQMCQTGTPDYVSPPVKYEVNKGAIASVVVIGFVLLIGCTCAVIYVAVIKPRRERAFHGLHT